MFKGFGPQMLLVLLFGCRSTAPEPIDVWNGGGTAPEGLTQTNNSANTTPNTSPNPNPSTTQPVQGNCNQLPAVPEGCTKLFAEALAGRVCLIDEVEQWLACCNCDGGYCELSNSLSAVQDDLLIMGDCNLAVQTAATTDTAI